MSSAQHPVTESLALVGREVAGVLDQLTSDSPQALDDLATLIADAPRIFVLGAGRSGL
ncbi:MAG: hypothetical protein JWR01_1963, partial [Subtercola sp.]|nr:hypothetical protein [Subtercola sp.]